MSAMPDLRCSAFYVPNLTMYNKFRKTIGHAFYVRKAPAFLGFPIYLYSPSIPKCGVPNEFRTSIKVPRFCTTVINVSDELIEQLSNEYIYNAHTHNTENFLNGKFALAVNGNEELRDAEQYMKSICTQYTNCKDKYEDRRWIYFYKCLNGTTVPINTSIQPTSPMISYGDYKRGMKHQQILDIIAKHMGDNNEYIN